MWFDSPNHCAAFIVMTIMLSIGVFLFFSDMKQRWAQILTWVLFCGVIVQEVILALTYSRGGYIALATGILFMCFFNRRKWAITFLISFFIVLLFTANGLDRVQSIVATEDGSIKNRFLLWGGGLSIIWNNLFFGVGADSVGKLYTAWYQPLWLDEAYKTLINDYFTITAAYGIFATFAYLTIVLSVLLQGLRLWRINKNPLLLSALGALTAYLTGALFTTFYCHWKVYWLFCLLLLFTGAFIVYKLYIRRFTVSARTVLIPCVSAFSLCLLITLCGFLIEKQVPYDVKSTVCQFKDKSVDLDKVYPKTTSKAVVLYIFSSEADTYEKAVRRIGRPLLSKNYTIFSLDVDSGLDGLSKASYALDLASNEASKNGCKLIIIGQGDGGKHAIITASKLAASSLNAVIAIGSPASWPFEQLAPDTHIKGLKVPLLLIHGKQDEVYPYTDSEKLKRLCDGYKISATLEVIDETGSNLDEKKAFVVELIDRFISKQAAVDAKFSDTNNKQQNVSAIIRKQ